MSEKKGGRPKAGRVSEEAVIEHLVQSMVAKAVKPTDIQTFEKDSQLNVPHDQSSEEREAKKRKYRELLHKSLLVAGHEKHPQVGTTTHAQEDVPMVSFDSAWSYSHRAVAHYICYLLLLRETINAQQQTAPFDSSLARYLTSASAALRDASSVGASTALNMASFVLDSKRDAIDPQILSPVLHLFRTIPPLSLCGWTRQALIIDKAVGKIKLYLLHILKSNCKAEAPLLQGALLALCHIGLARGTIEDLLLALHIAAAQQATSHSILAATPIGEIIERLLSLPEILQTASMFTLSLEEEALEERIPVEKLYLNVENALKDTTSELTSATDGVYLYLHSSKYGLLTLGAGQTKIKGKVYAAAPALDPKLPVPLLCLNRKLYCVLRGKLQRLNPQTLELKSTRKTAGLPTTRVFSIASTKQCIVSYLPQTQEGELRDDREGYQADVIYYDCKAKTVTHKYRLQHTVADLRHIVVCGEVITLVGKKRYTTIDLSQMKVLKNAESGLLQQATVCADPISGELYMTYIKDAKEGLLFGKLKCTHLMQDSTTYLEDQLKKVKERLQFDAQVKAAKLKREVSTLLGFYVPAEPEQAAKDVEAAFGSQWELLLALLCTRAQLAERAAKAATFYQPEQALKVFKAPMSVHLTGECIETQIALIELYFSRCREATEEPVLNLALANLCSVLVILNAHLVSLKVCELSLDECTGRKAAERCTQCFQDVIEPLARQKQLLLKVRADSSLLQNVVTTCEKLLTNSTGLIVRDIESVLKLLKHTLGELVKGEQSPGIEDRLASVATWLATNRNQEYVAQQLLVKDVACLSLLDQYFALEVQFPNHFFSVFLWKDCIPSL